MRSRLGSASPDETGQPREFPTWERRLASLVGSLLMFAGAFSVLLGRAGTPTVVLFIVSAPLVYAGLGLPMPTIQAGGARLQFKPPRRG